MDWSKIPPLASLRAFEAAARLGNYSAAGRELNVSHAAVTQQVRALEDYLGLKLAERSGRGIAVTAQGGLLAGHLTRGFGEIASALRQLQASEANRPVHITMTPSFAVSWFMPRMPLFSLAHPEIDLMVNPTPAPVDLAAGGFDLAIRFGTGDWPDLESEPLVPSHYILVGAPSLVGTRWDRPLEHLTQFPWLQELGTEEVRHWLEAHGIAMPADTHVTNIPGYMVLPALRNGQGITITARVFIEEDLAAGRLIELCDEPGDPRLGYHLVWTGSVQRPALKTFLAWLRRVARTERAAA